MLQDNLDAVSNDGSAGDPNSSCSILHAGWLLLNKGDGRRCSLVDCMVCHLLLHLNVDKHFALLIALAFCDMGLVEISLETVIDVSERIFVDMSDGGIQVVQSGEHAISIVSQSGRQCSNVVGVVEQSLSLQSLEKGKIARTVSCMQIVADKGDTLLPVQCFVRVEDDVEFCQLGFLFLSESVGSYLEI